MITDDARETSHLFQRVSVLIQRYNAVAFRGSFVEEDDDVIQGGPKKVSHRSIHITLSNTGLPRVRILEFFFQQDRRSAQNTLVL